MADMFPSLPEQPSMGDLFRRFPHSARPLLDYHDRVLRDASPLTVAQRELIAAYVSGLNSCGYCFGAHRSVARAFGIADDLFARLVDNVEEAPVEEAMKPLLEFAGKLTRTPSAMTASDAQAVYDAGWSEQALFDAISVCALFNLMNRLVEGVGLAVSDQSTALAGKGPLGSGDASAREAPHHYSALIDAWGLSERT